jgi:hypothetical protein
MQRASLVLIVLALAGCSSDPVQLYLGTWSFAAGNDNVSCPNGTTAAKLSGDITIQHSSDGGGLLVLDADSCNFTYTFDGNGAAANGKKCSFPVPELGQGVTAATTYDTIGLTTSDGKTMSDVFSGSVVYSSSAGSESCVFSGSGTLTKIGHP